MAARIEAWKKWRGATRKMRAERSKLKWALREKMGKASKGK